MSRTNDRSGLGFLLACCSAACTSSATNETSVESKPPAGAAEAAAKPDVKDDSASRPVRPKVDLQYFPGGASSKFSVSILAWLYRTGHAGKVGKATFITDSPSGPAPLGPSLRTIGSFAVPNVNLSNPPMHGLHIRNPVHLLPSDPPENGTGPHGGMVRRPIDAPPNSRTSTRRRTTSAT
jgi:hypothetical protein